MVILDCVGYVASPIPCALQRISQFEIVPSRMEIEPRILRLVRLFLRVAVLGFTGAVQPHEHEAGVQLGQIRGVEYAQIVYIAAGLGIRVIRVPDGPAGRISVFFLQYVVVFSWLIIIRSFYAYVDDSRSLNAIRGYPSFYVA